jgi:hypothetical protein
MSKCKYVEVPTKFFEGKEILVPGTESGHYYNVKFLNSYGFVATRSLGNNSIRIRVQVFDSQPIDINGFYVRSDTHASTVVNKSEVNNLIKNGIEWLTTVE